MTTGYFSAQLFNTRRHDASIFLGQKVLRQTEAKLQWTGMSEWWVEKIFCFLVWIMKASLRKCAKYRKPPVFLRVVAAFLCKWIYGLETHCFCAFCAWFNCKPGYSPFKSGPVGCTFPLSAARQSSIHVTSPCEYVGGNGPWNPWLQLYAH